MDVINFIGTTINIEVIEVDAIGFEKIMKDISKLSVTLEEFFFWRIISKD